MRVMMRAFLTLLLGAAVGCSRPAAGSLDAQEPDCTRVLFIGNSYTSVNDLPATFARVSAAQGHRVVTEMIAPGGARLADHLQSGQVRDQIRSGHWNCVVLQEQSVIPSMPGARDSLMFPAARALAREIRRAGARPVLYATWGRKNGWPEGGMPDYAAMQARLSASYRALGQELNAKVAPVGDAWALVVAGHPDIPLWQGDGSHPTEQGTFLAANVLMATLFRDAPKGLGARGNLSESEARALQEAAARAVPGLARVPDAR
jgi:hypothetical protein